VDLSITAQAHHIAPAGSLAKPGDQLITRKRAIRQQRDRPKPVRSRSAFSSRAIETDALKLAWDAPWSARAAGSPWHSPQPNPPPRRNGSRAWWCRETEARAGLSFASFAAPRKSTCIQRLNVNAAVGQPALTAALPACRQETRHRQPAIKADGFIQEEPGQHPGQKIQMIASRAVLTQESHQLSMDAGRGCQEDLNWFRSPTLTWLPAHPIS